MRTLRITTEQRDALYESILDHLSGIGDLWLAIESDNYDRADRLGREFADDLRFVLDNLGFGDGSSGESIELTTPADVLTRVLRRLEEQAESAEREAERESAAARAEQDRNRLVRETCRQLLSAMEGR